ncbi:hypothetical protein LX32DRAFT_673121 [Colletotrichum zoysiae]|uniref:Rhodopsin domain-containing protein n=1 Tax=Colletotrichum zoysiae TaxID=1216348 RepID=A0AAD9HH69_9PEZI|nr:hypothetical protein LX32DRAFT_673121 [Colletotrichum zoysiae]
MADDDRVTRLLASTWTLVGTSAILLFLRIHCKIWRGRGLWWDDHLLIVAWTSLAISVSIDTYIISLGFGRHMSTISDQNKKTINLFTILVATFGTLATTLSKTSFALMLYRIVINEWLKYFLIFIIVTINISMNLVWMFGFAKCTPLAKVWDASVPGKCWDKTRLVKYQSFTAYYSASLDFVLAFLPWPILMGTALRRRERLGVAVAMSLGAIAGACGIVKGVLMASMTSTDITYDRVDLTIWTLTEPAASIMAVSIPVLRMLYRELRSSQRSYPRNTSQSQSNTLEVKRTKTARDDRRNSFGIDLVNAMPVARVEESQGVSPKQECDSIPRAALKTESMRENHDILPYRSRVSSIELDFLNPRSA